MTMVTTMMIPTMVMTIMITMMEMTMTTTMATVMIPAFNQEITPVQMSRRAMPDVHAHTCSGVAHTPIKHRTLVKRTAALLLIKLLAGAPLHGVLLPTQQRTIEPFNNHVLFGVEHCRVLHRITPTLKTTMMRTNY